MIVGVGSDLCNIERIERSLDRFGDRFLTRVFTETERKKAASRPHTLAGTLAKRFAAKEAFSKAVGTGFKRGVYMKDIRPGRVLEASIIGVALLLLAVGGGGWVDSHPTIRQFFESNRAQFNVPETRYRVAQIVVTPVRDRQVRNRANDDATTPEEAQRKVQMLMSRLKEGADFATLAAEHSEDPQTAPQGGALGFIPVSALSQVAPELRKAVVNAKPGNVSVIPSAGGYTLVLLVGREEAGQRDLSTPGVKEGIQGALRERKEQLLSAAYLANARNDAKVVNYLARQVIGTQGSKPAVAPSAPSSGS